MPPTDFEGNTPPIEDLFYLLNTRLSFIRAGIAKQGKYYDGEDYECKPHEVFFEIHSKVHRHNRALVLSEIEDSLELIQTIQESIDKMPQEEERDTSHEWYVPIDNTMKIKEELENYKIFLEGLKENPILLRQSSTVTNLDSNLDRIKINISVEQLGALIYFLNDEKYFEENVKIFKSDLTKICKIFTSVFILPNGNNISEDSLYNSVSALKKNEMHINFWKEKFIKYTNQSIRLLTEINKINIINKRKK